MSPLLERPLLALAWLVAMVILALGIRRLRISDRRGLFLTALSFFVALQGAASPDAAAKDPKLTADRINLPLPPELRDGETWTKFKDLWRRLDAVAPRAEGDPHRLASGTYTMAVEPEQQEVFRVELAGILGIQPGELYQLQLKGPPQKEGVERPDVQLSTLTQALAVVTLKRIEHMGMDRTMMMRMVPPPTLQFRGSVVEQIERRIDSLMALRAKEAVTETELKAALAKLQDDVWVHSLLAVFDDYRLGTFGPIAAPGAAAVLPDPSQRWDALWFDATAWLRGFEQVCAPRDEAVPTQQATGPGHRDKETLKAACRQAREGLELLQGVRGDLAALVADLETP
ncbi:MAG: hypothetical protein ABIK09_10720 [Pseudomonadota bacterium]